VIFEERLSKKAESVYFRKRLKYNHWRRAFTEFSSGISCEVLSEVRNRRKSGRAPAKVEVRMKRISKYIAVIAGLTLLTPGSFALPAAKAKAIKKAVSSVPGPEMPAIAAELVAKAAREDREEVAVTALRSAIYKHRASAPSVVAAIAKVAPEVAGAVTRAATEMEVGQAGAITSAALTAAPTAKREIVASVYQAVTAPNSGAVANTSAAQNTTAPGFTSRPSAANPHSGGTIGQDNFPINRERGGNGNGHFPTAPPPHAGPPDKVDYHRPRGH
jgi:hypothetical protein